jgi:large subunit ribosomal protein L21e
MVKSPHGARNRTRHSLRKKTREKGKVRIRAQLQIFKIGDAVLVKPDSAYHKGMPFKRFFGKQGKVSEVRGKSYLVDIREGGKHKQVICSPVHLRKL